MDYITRLKQKEEFEYWLGADNEQILYVENELNIKLPKQYKHFLSQCSMCTANRFSCRHFATMLCASPSVIPAKRWLSVARRSGR